MLTNILDKDNLSILLEGDQQSGINETKVPRTQNKLFKPFKIIRDSIRSSGEEERISSKVSKIHNEKLTGPLKYQCNHF